MKAVQQKAPAPKGMSSQPPKILLAEEKIMRSKPVLRKKKTEPVTRSLLKAQTAHSEQTAEPMKITLPTKAELATESPANRQVKPIKTGQATASVKITALKPKNCIIDTVHLQRSCKKKNKKNKAKQRVHGAIPQKTKEGVQSPNKLSIQQKHYLKIEPKVKLSERCPVPEANGKQ